MSTTTSPRSIFDGPFAFVEGLDPEAGDIFPAPPVPQFIVQSTTPGHFQVGSVDPRHNGRSVDGIDYTDFATARAERDMRNAEQPGGAR